MLLITISIASVASIGLFVVLANPRRMANRAFGLFSLSITSWLALCYAQRLYWTSGDDRTALLFVRLNGAFSLLIPWILAVLNVTLALREPSAKRTFLKSSPWLLVALCSAPLTFTESYISSSPDHFWQRGHAYAIHIGILMAMTLAVVMQATRNINNTIGIRRLEIQFTVLNIGSVMLITLGVLAAGNLLAMLAIKRAAFALLLISYIITAWALAFHRIFDVWHVFRYILHRAAIAGLMAGGVVTSSWLIGTQSLTLPIIFANVATWGLIALAMDRPLRKWLQIDDERNLAKLRREVIALARSEPETSKLVLRYKELLQDRFHTPAASLLLDRDTTYCDTRLSLEKKSYAYDALLESEWVTHESLLRRRSSARLRELQSYLKTHSLAIMVAVPRGSPSPSLLVALATRVDELPFTYPEVVRLQNIAELMDNILTHSRLSAQAALQVKIEHLAMMSRGLAHDLKNLITPVSSFLIHTDGHYAPGSPEAEVHAAARRSVRVMTDYVRDALFFSERLQPKLELVDLPTLFNAVQELTASRAADHGVKVCSRINVPQPVVADGVLLQRMLVNLVSNAIDASASGQGVTLWADTCDEGLRLQVCDEGCGVPAENLSRIFEPYFTTKQFGDDVRGFGLGLTICQKITNLHAGTITLQSELGKGTRVTVVLPSIPAPERLRPGPPCLALP